MKKKLPAILALLTTTIGLVTSPLVLDLLPPHWSATVIAFGGFVQALTKSLKGEV